ncbi:MAG: hypothetical protein ACLPKB_31735 [Xanthobacteraceae bacterium]
MIWQDVLAVGGVVVVVGVPAVTVCTTCPPEMKEAVTNPFVVEVPHQE